MFSNSSPSQVDPPKGHRAEHKQFPYRTGTENPVIAVVIKYNLLDRNEIKIKVLLSSEFTLYPWLHNRFPRPSQNKQKKRKRKEVITFIYSLEFLLLEKRGPFDCSAPSSVILIGVFPRNLTFMEISVRSLFN